jgi:hypothetical protein
MGVRVVRANGELAIEVGPAFLPEDARAVCEMLELLAPGTRATIDFARVRDCQDVALSLLAREIASGGAQVSLRGTSQHQQRLLRYLGVDVPPPEQADLA